MSISDTLAARTSKPQDVRFFTHYGMTFRRENDGTVRIEQTGIEIARLDPHTWASVVASMSKGGEDYQSYAQARDFHLGAQGE